MKRSKGKHNTWARHGKISGFRRSYESATKLLERERNHIQTTGRRVSGSPGSRSRGAFEIPAEDGFRYGTFTIDAFSCAPTFPGIFAGAYGCCSPRGCEQRPHVTAVPARGLSTVFASAEVAWEQVGKLQGKADWIRRKRPRSPQATAQLANARKALGPRRDFSDSATGTACPPLRRNPGPDARPDHPAKTQNTGVFWPAGSQARTHARVHTRMYTQPPSPVQEAPSDQSKLRNRERGAKNL